MMLRRHEKMHDTELWEYVHETYEMVPPLTDPMKAALQPHLHTDTLVPYFREQTIADALLQAIEQLKEIRLSLDTGSSFSRVTPFGWRYDRKKDRLYLLLLDSQDVRAIWTNRISDCLPLGPSPSLARLDSYFDEATEEASVILHPKGSRDETRLLMMLSGYSKQFSRSDGRLFGRIRYEIQQEARLRQLFRMMGDRIVILGPDRLRHEMRRSLEEMIIQYED